MTVSNNGASTANGLTVTDPLPTGTSYISSAGTGWTITDNNNTVTATDPSLAVGASSSFTITVQVPSTPGSITNTATVSSTTPDSNPNNQSSVTTQVTGMADLSIVKTASASSVTVGSPLTYTLTVSNLGNIAANGISVTDPLPTGTTYVSSAGSGWTITDNNNIVTATMPSMAAGGSVLLHDHDRRTERSGLHHQHGHGKLDLAGQQSETIKVRSRRRLPARMIYRSSRRPAPAPWGSAAS